MESCMTLERDGGVCPVKLSVTDAGISWSFFHNGLCQTEEIRIQQLLAPRIHSEAGESRLIVQYAKITVHAKNKIQVRCTEIAFLSSYNDCVSMKTKIEELLQSKEPHRPKSVLVFMNPKAGNATSVKDYHNVVAPLFRRCGVDVDAIVTKSETHAIEVLDEYDISSIDAVASMGGDGSFAQVTNGLIRRAMKDAHADIDDPNVEVVAPSLPFGPIPCGSGCAVSVMTTGTVMDIETSVIAIILVRKPKVKHWSGDVIFPMLWQGWTEPFDVLGTRHKGKYSGFANLMSGCGIIISVFDWLECVKWMLGRRRYWFILPRCWWTWMKFDVTVHYLPARDSEGNTGFYGVETNAIAETDYCITEGPYPGWKTLRCKVSDIWIMKSGIRDVGERIFYTSSYIRPQLKTGKATLVLCTGANFMEMMKAYRSLFGIDKSVRPYLRAVEVEEVKVNVSQSGSRYNYMTHDGIMENVPNGTVFETVVHSGLLTTFALNRELVEPLFGGDEGEP